MGGYELLRVAIGLLLLTAAALKLSESGLVGATTSVWDVGQIAFEAALGVWLLLGWFGRAAWITSLAAFSLFAAYSAYGALAGWANCGCFGAVELSPWITLGMDAVVVVALLVWRPPAAANAQLPRQWPAVAGLAMTVAVLLGGAVLDAGGQPQGGNEVVANPALLDGPVDPQSWPGKPLPLLEMIDIGDQLKEGRWQVMFYRHDCPHCVEMIEAWLSGPPAPAGAIGWGRALVEIPPYGNLPAAEKAAARQWKMGHLSDARRWRFRSPQFVELADGVVQQVAPEPLQIATTPATPVSTSAEKKPVAPRTATDNPGTPRAAQFQQPAPYNLGYVVPGSDHEFKVSVFNNLERDLPVLRVTSECDCLTALDTPEVLAAGGSTELKVQLSAWDKVTHYQKGLTLWIDDEEVPHVMVDMTARIGLPLRVEPQVLSFGDDGESPAPAAASEGGGEPMAVRQVFVHNDSDQPVRLAYSTSNLPGAYASVPREPVPAGGVQRVEIRVPPSAFAAKDAGRLDLYTELEDQPILRIKLQRAAATEK